MDKVKYLEKNEKVVTLASLFSFFSAGSGKTLSFGIPMIHRILEWKTRLSDANDDPNDKPESVVDVESIYLPSVSDSKVDEEDSTEEISAVAKKDEGQDQNEDEDDHDGESGSDNDQSQDADDAGIIQTLDLKAKELEEECGLKQPLLGLVLTPTRELAVQVKHHIDAVAQFTGL